MTSHRKERIRRRNVLMPKLASLIKERYKKSTHRGDKAVIMKSLALDLGTSTKSIYSWLANDCRGILPHAAALDRVEAYLGVHWQPPADLPTLQVNPPKPPAPPSPPDLTSIIMWNATTRQLVAALAGDESVHPAVMSIYRRIDVLAEAIEDECMR